MATEIAVGWGVWARGAGTDVGVLTDVGGVGVVGVSRASNCCLIAGSVAMRLCSWVRMVVASRGDGDVLMLEEEDVEALVAWA